MVPRAWAVAAAAALLAGLVAASVLDRLAPTPTADVARGSEEAFVRGLYPREFTGGGRAPERWTQGQVVVGFERVPPGPRRLHVALRHHRQPVAVAVDGVLVGSVPPGVASASFVLPASRRADLDVVLRLETFVAGDGRRLGAHFDRVTLEHGREALPAQGLVAQCALLALGVLLAAAAGGCAPSIASALALLALGLFTGLLWPCGLVRSPYAWPLTCLVLGAAALSACFARWRASRQRAGPPLPEGPVRPAVGPWAFAALFVALAVHAIVLTSPMVVMSDAVFHANKLRQVAGGDLFPVSQTQHAPPFRFPYGTSFYALLGPLYWAGADALALVRYGAGIAAALGGALLFVLTESAPARAALAVLLLVTLPISSDVFAYGNLSNVFGQTATLASLSWWLHPRGGALLGTLVLLVALLSHLSATIVLAVLIVCLAALSGRPTSSNADPAGRRGLGRARTVAIAIAGALALLYYAQFIPLMLEQLPRLGQGAGSGERRLSVLESVARQARSLVDQWGWPALVLLALGWPRTGRDRNGALADVDRALLACWLAGAALLLIALLSPLEVRYLYFLTFALAHAAATGAERLAARGRAPALLAVGVVAVQVALAVQQAVDIVLHRYRIAAD